MTNIGAQAFLGCYKLTSVTLGKNLELIGTNAFKGCDSLIAFTSENHEPPYVDFLCDDRIYTQAKLFVPIDAIEKYKNTSPWNLFSNILDISQSGIDDVFLDSNNPVIIYNIMGHKLSHPQRGVNIINGRKVLVQ